MDASFRQQFGLSRFVVELYHRIMLPVILSLVIVLVGLVLLVRALRCTVDDHPVCRACSYDLVGSPGAERCPECGADLRLRRAVRHGNRAPRRGTVAIGLGILFAGLSWLGILTLTDLPDYDWIRLKPFGWTLNNALDHAGTPGESNVTELGRRLTFNELSDAQVTRLVEAALTVQGDRTITWPNGWSDVLDQLLATGTLDDAQVKRYLEQAIAYELKIKPKIRQGRNLRLDLSGEIGWLTVNTRFDVARRAEAVVLGDVEIIGAGGFNGDATNTHYFRHGYTLSTGLRGRDVPLGPTTLETTLTFDITLVQPRAYPTVTIRVPISTPTEITDRDAFVDEFATEEGNREKVEAIWRRTRVETDEDELSVWCWLEPSPVALSMGVWLVQAEREWRIGGLHVEANDAGRWHRRGIDLSRQPDLPTSGTVDVVLRPEQEPSDTTLDVGRYWGGMLLVEDIVVNAPYEPAFNMDASHAEAMEKAVYLDTIIFHRGERPRISASLNAFEPPVRVAYRIRVRAGGDWVDAPTSILLFSPANSSTGYSTGGLPLPDPEASHVDIMFVPDHDWESRSADQTPPWGYPILFEQIPVSYDGVLRQPIYGRALIEDASE